MADGTGTGAGTTTGDGTGGDTTVGTGAGAAGGTVGVAGADSGVERLLAAVRAGRAADVPALLEPLDDAARKTALAQLKELRAEVDAGKWAAPAFVANRIRGALYVAGAGCLPGVAAAASWLGARDLLTRSADGGRLALSALGDRGPEWAADLAGRLAKRRAVAEAAYPLVHGLMSRSGQAVPPTDGYVTGWIRHITDDRLVERLREDPRTPALVAHALAMAATPEPFTRTVRPGSPRHWPTALRTLVTEGTLDRAQILDLCVTRLLRGGPARNLRFPLEVTRLLEPGADELRKRIPDWVGLASDAPSAVAGYAQDVLADLAAAGALPVAALAEMTAGVLFRTEKKLVRAQLALVGRVLAREPGAAGALLPAVTEAFGNDDTSVQERALKLVGRHLRALEPEVRRELAETAGLLSPTHRQAAEALFGDALEGPAGAAYEEILPPVPERQPVGPPVTTVEALMEQLVVERLSEDPVAFERALDGLVRLAHRDRTAVVEAVRETFPRTEWQDASSFTDRAQGIEVVLAGLLGLLDQARVDLGRTPGHGADSCFHEALSGVLDVRLWEAADLIGTGALPFLLATPTWHTGGIDPPVLVERLRACRDAGVEPAPADLAQALLRVLRRDPSAGRAAEEAAALGTPAGRGLAAWLREEDAVAASVRFLVRGREPSPVTGWLIDRIVVDVDDRATVREEFPPAFTWLGGALEGVPRRCHHGEDSSRAQWATVLPADRDVLAACLLPSLAGCVDGSARGATEPLTTLVEAEGPVGRAVHLVLAFGLGCVDADDRLRAVDAMLVLASRGELNARRLGAELAWLVAEGSVKPNRLADAARTAADTGAYGTVWTVLAAMLPGPLSAATPVRGLGEVLAVAADCVERCGARDEPAGLDALASGRGSTQLVVQARRLRNALRQGTDQSLAETA
ncbi:DUF6493 family protein [Streptomyces sp. CB02261]|uniref:DUF6493 family protein n=1 Tax=Streptomyces sp. CB02261 TaxID=1703940 RepID=UPI0018E9B983|nr:DUF6493 family protein [Streptomyces sp. CB02261]